MIHTQKKLSQKTGYEYVFPHQSNMSCLSLIGGICISHVLEFLIMKWEIHPSMPNIIAIKMRHLPNCPKRDAVIEGRNIVIICLGFVL